jgi:hypothetical protein
MISKKGSKALWKLPVGKKVETDAKELENIKEGTSDEEIQKDESSKG